MPSWKTHLIFDLVFTTVLVGIGMQTGLITNIYLISSLILFNLISAVFPDIDTTKSKIRGHVSLLLSVVLTIYILFNFKIHSVLGAIMVFFFLYILLRFFPTKHRGMTHRIWFSILFSGLLTSIIWYFYELPLYPTLFSFLVIFWGYLSHILVDKL